MMTLVICALIGVSWQEPEIAGADGYRVFLHVTNATTETFVTTNWVQSGTGFTNEWQPGLWTLAIQPLSSVTNFWPYEFPKIIVGQPKPIRSTTLAGQMQSSPTPDGPWTNWATFTLTVPMWDSNQFYRANADLTPPLPP